MKRISNGPRATSMSRRLLTNMQEVELVIFCGLQASGKTTFYARRFAATHVLVSKDILRNNRHPGRRQAQLIAEALASGRSVVVDNTNATPADRSELIALGRTYGARIVGYWFPPDVRASLARNAQRAGRARVPPVAIYATTARLVPPSYAEGFDALYTVRIAKGGDFAVEEVPVEDHRGNQQSERRTDDDRH